MFVVHIVVEPWSPSVCVDCVHLSGERLVELVCALICPLHAKIQIHVGLNSFHDAPLPVHLVEGQVPDKQQDRDEDPRVFSYLPGVLVPQLRLKLL